MRYYKPTPEELLNTKDLALQMYDEEESSWTNFVYDCTVHMDIALDDLRIKYLMAEDLNALGYATKKLYLGKQTQIKDILEDRKAK